MVQKVSYHILIVNFLVYFLVYFCAVQNDCNFAPYKFVINY